MLVLMAGPYIAAESSPVETHSECDPCACDRPVGLLPLSCSGMVMKKQTENRDRTTFRDFQKRRTVKYSALAVFGYSIPAAMLRISILIIFARGGQK